MDVSSSSSTHRPGARRLAEQPAPAALAPGERAGFAYDGLSLSAVEGLDVALPGKPGRHTAKAANQTITPMYEALSRGMTAYMGEPALPNWATFGQYASRYAGTSIAELEAAQKGADAMHSVRNLLVHPVRQVKQLAGAVRQAFNDRRNGDVEALGRQGARMLGAHVDWRRPWTLLTLPKRLNDSLASVLKAMAQGNQGIMRNIAPAFDTFLRAEAAGRNGLTALEAAGYRPGTSRDPGGFVHAAFASYREAQALGRRAGALEERNPERAALLARREACVSRANLLLGMQEQLYILQPILDGHGTQGVMATMQGTMAIEDPSGRYPLLPDGGNWQDFATRMGLVAAGPDAPGAIAVPIGGVTHHFTVPSPPLPGTISAYFARGLEPGHAQALLNGKPKPLI